MTNFVGSADPENEVIRMTFEGLKGIKMVDFHHEFREYFKSTGNPTALEFLQQKAAVQVENLLFWQVELVRQSLKSLTDNKLFELEKKLGADALKSFLQSETGKGTIPPFRRILSAAMSTGITAPTWIPQWFAKQTV
jgi:hypothetical protein